MPSLPDQLRRHSVALISLVVALSSLAYNTWRNEKTEENRNVRTAGIELILKLGELDRLVFFSHFAKDAVRGDPKEGWAYVLTIRDLGRLTHEPAMTSAAELHRVWDQSWEGLESDRASADRISDAIDRTREDLLTVLAALD